MAEERQAALSKAPLGPTWEPAAPPHGAGERTAPSRRRWRRRRACSRPAAPFLTAMIRSTSRRTSLTSRIGRSARGRGPSPQQRAWYASIAIRVAAGLLTRTDWLGPAIRVFKLPRSQIVGLQSRHSRGASSAASSSAVSMASSPEDRSSTAGSLRASCCSSLRLQSFARRKIEHDRTSS